MTQRGMRMQRELGEAPEVVRRQTEAAEGPLRDFLALLRRRPPDLIITCARGSSAHAASFAKHLIERHLALPVSAFAPNIATIYRRQLRIRGQVFLVISQSGRSDDLIESAQMAKAAGALVVALVNDVASPLANASDIVLPMSAGEELSVAATKTFVASLAALLRLVSQWAGDAGLAAAIERLPERLARATQLDWETAVSALAAANSLVTIGRGPTLAIAREAALKLKETCNLHAEAFSGAEFLHGPVALVEMSYPMLVFLPTDEAAAGLRELAADLRHKGANVFVTSAQAGAGHAAGQLPALTPDYPDADAVCLIQSFYAMAVRLAARRGADVDVPRHLRKVTRTR